MEIFSIIVQFFDILLSSIVSVFNILRDLWREVLLGALILVAALAVLRALRAIRRRTKFVKAIKLAAKENGVTVRFRRPSVLSLFWNFSGYDLELDIRGILYRLKFYPGITLGRAVHMRSATETLWQGRLANRSATSGRGLRGIPVRLKYDNSEAEGVVNILVFSPTPIAVTEKNSSGVVWELDTENGGVFDGVYLFTEDVLVSRLPRLIDGYIDSLVRHEEV